MELTEVMKSKWTGERLLTSIYSGIAVEHLHRYSIALEYVCSKVVLDIACGEGYGSNLLSQKSSFVYGVDIDNQTIENAKHKYNRENIQFLQGSTSRIPLDKNSVDVVVSLETIEHHSEHNEMIYEIKRVLKPNGILIISTPDKYYYSDIRNKVNTHHIKELYKSEFENLISKNFKEFQLLVQTNLRGCSIISKSKENSDINFYDGDFSEINSISKKPLYLISIASNIEFLKQEQSVFDGNRIIEQNIRTELKKSITYKIGNLILRPFKVLRKKIRV